MARISTRRTGREVSSGWEIPSLRDTRSAIIWSRARAYGRAATMAFWARRSLAAETIFIAW
jgi:hypothetical protein